MEIDNFDSAHLIYIRRRWKSEGGGRLVVRKLNAVAASTPLNSPLYVHTCIVYRCTSADCKLWWVNRKLFTQSIHYKLQKYNIPIKTNSITQIWNWHLNTIPQWYVIITSLSSSFGEFASVCKYEKADRDESVIRYFLFFSVDFVKLRSFQLKIRTLSTHGNRTPQTTPTRNHTPRNWFAEIRVKIEERFCFSLVVSALAKNVNEPERN